MSVIGFNLHGRPSGNLLFCYLAIGHEHELPDRHPVVCNGNRFAGLPLLRHFPGNANRILKIIGGVKHIFGVLADNVELGHFVLIWPTFVIFPHQGRIVKIAPSRLLPWVFPLK